MGHVSVSVKVQQSQCAAQHGPEAVPRLSTSACRNAAVQMPCRRNTAATKARSCANGVAPSAGIRCVGVAVAAVAASTSIAAWSSSTRAASVPAASGPVAAAADAPAAWATDPRRPPAAAVLPPLPSRSLPFGVLSPSDFAMLGGRGHHNIANR